MPTKRNARDPSFVRFEHYAAKFLRSEVDDSTSFNVNGSSTPVRFSYQVPTGMSLYAHRLNWSLVDTQLLNANEFGSLSALSNGCLLQLERSDGLKVWDPLDGETIKYNFEWAHYAGVDVRVEGRGCSMRWTWSKATGGTSVLFPSGYKLVWIVRDNLSALDDCSIMVQGELRDERE